VIAPAPGNVPAGTTVATTFTYSSLGNILSVTTGGNNLAPTRTTTFQYTDDVERDGTLYHQSEHLGQPIKVTNSAQNQTHARYDSRGNQVREWNAQGNESDQTFDIANRVSSIYLT